MIQDFFLSFRENIKQKTTNPFFGALIIVWIIHNWELIYTLFHFESDIKLSEKIEFIKQFMAPIPFLINLGMCIIASILVLIVTYFLLNLSRLIVNLYEKRLTPFIYKITDSSSIVLKTDYEKIEKKLEQSEMKYNKERDLRLQIQDERDKLEAKVGELLNSDKSYNTILENHNNDEDITGIYESIKENKHIDILGQVIEFIGTGNAIKTNDPGVRFLGKIGILSKLDKQAGVGYAFYKLTNLGEKIRDLYLNENVFKRK